MDLVRTVAVLAVLAATAAPGLSATGSTAAKADPDRQICRSKPVVGSRLKRIRECHTAQEWDDLKLQEQVGLMRKQFNGDPGCSGGHAESCHPMGKKDTPW